METKLPLGFRYAGVAAGIKSKPNALDVSLIVSDSPATGVAVTTQNQVVAAPVLVCRRSTPAEDIRGVIINSGNANACTGAQGKQDAQRMCELAAAACGPDVDPAQMLVMSTGLIGKCLPMQRIESGIAAAGKQLNSDPSSFIDASDAILTTDQGRKVCCRELTWGSQTVRIAGMAKGAGMIGPNMATMLCCLVSDIRLPAGVADPLLREAVDASFNRISVEGHTSTNDTVVLLAGGQAGAPPGDAQLADFAQQLREMCVELAKMIPADGEGAEHLIEIRVIGAASDAQAQQIAATVASSNLVKTAVFGNDPNWGRIVSAAGYAGVPLEMSQVDLRLNGILLFAGGEPMQFDARAASESMRNGPETQIELRVGQGSGSGWLWTSDLTVEYVRFNSEYTT